MKQRKKNCLILMMTFLILSLLSGCSKKNSGTLTAQEAWQKLEHSDEITLTVFMNNLSSTILYKATAMLYAGEPEGEELGTLSYGRLMDEKWTVAHGNEEWFKIRPFKGSIEGVAESVTGYSYYVGEQDERVGYVLEAEREGHAHSYEFYDKSLKKADYYYDEDAGIMFDSDGTELITAEIEILRTNYCTITLHCADQGKVDLRDKLFLLLRLEYAAAENRYSDDAWSKE